MVNTVLINPEGKGELTLNLNGKRSKQNRSDFLVAFNTLALDEKQQQNLFVKMAKARPAGPEMLRSSFLSADFQEQYLNLLEARFKVLYQCADWTRSSERKRSYRPTSVTP